MQARAAGLAIAVALTWSLDARAQLQPPPPMQPLPAPGWGPPPQQSATVQQLNAADNAGSFRGLEIAYLNAEAGGTYVNLGSQFAGSQGGAAFGVGVGVRFLYFTLGIRGRIAPVSAYTLFEANLELGVHLPQGAWDPYINVHGGYAHAAMNSQQLTINVGGAEVDLGQATPASPSGGDVGGSLGTDYYFSALFSLGVDATLDALIVGTQGQTVVFGGQSYTFGAQSSTGVGFIGSLHAGLHFDL